MKNNNVFLGVGIVTHDVKKNLKEKLKNLFFVDIHNDIEILPILDESQTILLLNNNILSEFKLMQKKIINGYYLLDTKYFNTNKYSILTNSKIINNNKGIIIKGIDNSFLTSDNIFNYCDNCIGKHNYCKECEFKDSPFNKYNTDIKEIINHNDNLEKYNRYKKLNEIYNKDNNINRYLEFDRLNNSENIPLINNSNLVFLKHEILIRLEIIEKYYVLQDNEDYLIELRELIIEYIENRYSEKEKEKFYKIESIREICKMLFPDNLK